MIFPQIYNLPVTHKVITFCSRQSPKWRVWVIALCLECSVYVTRNKPLAFITPQNGLIRYVLTELFLLLLLHYCPCVKGALYHMFLHLLPRNIGIRVTHQIFNWCSWAFVARNNLLWMLAFATVKMGPPPPHLKYANAANVVNETPRDDCGGQLEESLSYPTSRLFCPPKWADVANWYPQNGPVSSGEISKMCLNSVARCLQGKAKQYFGDTKRK